MKMLNRILALVAALLLAVTPALADRSDAASAFALPGCYRYLTPGAAVMFSAAAASVYAQPSTAAGVVGWVPANTTVNVVALDASQQWAFVTAEGLTGGWVSASVLVMEDVLLNNNAVIVAGEAGLRVNLRTMPAENSPSQGKYYTGTLCQIVDPNPVWEGQTAYVLVRIGALTGYMDSRRLANGLINAWVDLPSVMVMNAYSTQHAIYATPDWTSQVVGYVTNGTYVTVLGIRNDGWYHVMCRGVEGFIQSNVLITQLPWDLDAVDPETGESVDVMTNATVTLPSYDGLYVVSSKPGNRVNLRTKPSTDSVSLCKYYTGTPVTQLGPEENGYMFISIGHLKGYMDVRFISDEPYDRESELVRCIVQPTEGAACAPLYRWNEFGSEIVCDIYYGEEVILIGIDGTWGHVVYGDTHGFIQRTELFEIPEM